MIDLKCLTTKEVARLCRVSDATVKRWQDAGLIQSERTSGGHRRFRAEEVVRFQRKQGLGLKQTHGDESVTSATNRRHDDKTHSNCPLFRSLIAGCEEAAANTLINEHLYGESLAKIFDDTMCPAMRLIGELWSAGDVSVTEEHLATRADLNDVYKLRSVLPVPKMTGYLAICCTVEGDLHELPAHLAQMIIENEGWEVLNFGANTPLYCLAEEAVRHSPKIVCISATVVNDVERLARDYKNFSDQLSKLKIPILIGGRIFEDERIRQRFPAQFYARNFAELAEIARDLSKSN